MRCACVFTAAVASDRGVDGRYWSSTTAPGNESNSFSLVLAISGVEPSSTGPKYEGKSIRCTVSAGT